MKQLNFSKWVNDNLSDKVYEIMHDNFGNLCVQEIRSDGYYTKLGIDQDQLLKFEKTLLKNGWTKTKLLLKTD